MAAHSIKIFDLFLFPKFYSSGTLSFEEIYLSEIMLHWFWSALIGHSIFYSQSECSKRAQHNFMRKFFRIGSAQYDFKFFALSSIHTTAELNGRLFKNLLMPKRSSLPRITPRNTLHAPCECTLGKKREIRRQCNK